MVLRNSILRKHWKLIVAEYTGMKWSKFSESKNEMIESTCKWLNKGAQNNVLDT